MRRCCVRISLCEDGSFEVVTVVESLGPITTMGASGRHSANPSHSELLILPGADMWDTGGRRGVRRRRALLDAGVPVAATCGGTADSPAPGCLTSGTTRARPSTTLRPPAIEGATATSRSATAVAAHPWIMRVPGCASCHASIAASHSSPPRAVSEAG